MRGESRESIRPTLARRVSKFSTRSSSNCLVICTMKLLIFLAVLTLVRGTELEQSDEILKELESLVDGKVAKENDDSELEELIKIIKSSDEPESLSDDPEPISDEAFEKLMLEVEENDEPIKPRGYKPTRNRGDAKCRDNSRKCERFKRNCKSRNQFVKNMMSKKCGFTCGFCKPAKCEDSRFGCCKDLKTFADGKGEKGCPLKMCQDVQGCAASLTRIKGACKREGFSERCPVSCKLCEPKQHTEAKCDADLGFGCCDIDGKTPALGAKRGCDDNRQPSEFKVPKATCKDEGYGCCRTDGSKAAKGPKQGCIACRNAYGNALCRRITKGKDINGKISSKYLCNKGGLTSMKSLRRLCPKWCGFCKRT